MATSAVPWRAAWDQALYAEHGFFRRSTPADHFRTSAHVAGYAEAIAELARRTGARTVVDLGAGGGELLADLLPLVGGEVDLIGVEIAPRPAALPPAVTWLPQLPQRVDGLLIANEWLDNVPCDVVEMDHAGVVREVLVNPTTGVESLGDAYESPWLSRWWPLREPGDRAEVGEARDAAWGDAVGRVDGIAIAIDYGHTRDDRPPFGSLRSYVNGRETDVVPDGARDVTAHVSVDAVAAATGATLVRQRDALGRLGVDATRPPLESSRSDPSGYVRALARATEAGELIARGGLGDFWWIVTETGGHGTLTP
jgi:SAM-dependent MidA family methyltransferase